MYVIITARPGAGVSLMLIEEWARTMRFAQTPTEEAPLEEARVLRRVREAGHPDTGPVGDGQVFRPGQALRLAHGYA